MVMKSGVIIYVAGNAPENWTEEKETPIKKSESEADLIEIITTKTGHLEIIDAWREFIARGMEKVTCKMAVFGKSGNIEFTGNQLRLCG
jgi:hypothetical protein